MKIDEVVSEGRGGGSASANQSSSFTQDLSDFASRVGSDISDTGKFLGQTAKAAIDPETYKQLGRDVQSGYELAKKDPKQALKNIGQTADDTMRAAANAATLGGADWVASKLGGTDLQTQQDLSQAAWERSPKASMAGAVGGSVLDPVFLGGAKVGSKVASKLIPKAKSIPGKAASGATKFGTSTVGGFAADRAAADTVDSTVYENTELSDIQKLAGQSLDEGWKFKAPNVHGMDIARGDPNVKKAQGIEPTDASYQERARAAQQKKTAATASGDVDVNMDPKYAAQQKQIQALSDKISAQEKAAKNEKTWSRVKKGVVGTGLVGGGAYLYNKTKPESKWLSDITPDEQKFIDDFHDANTIKMPHPYQSIATPEPKPTNEPKPEINTNDNTQSTNTDNGTMFNSQTFKTNEGDSELHRVKKLLNYGKQI